MYSSHEKLFDVKGVLLIAVMSGLVFRKKQLEFAFRL